MSNSESHDKGEEILRRLQAGRDQDDLFTRVGEIFPDFLEVMTVDHLFGDVWSRTALSPRERMMITLALLVASRCTNALKAHIRYALNSGLTREEIMEVIMHTASYTCWGSGVNALRSTSAVYSEMNDSPT